MILKTLNHRRKELEVIIEQSLSCETREFLDRLLEKATDVNDEPINRSRLTLLKRCSQSTRPGKIKESISDLELIRGLQEQVQPVLEKLGLPYDGISYFANSVIRSETFKVTRRAEKDRYLPISGPVALELLSPISTGSPFKGIRQNAVKIHPKRFSRKNLVSFPCQTMEKCNFDFRDGNTRRTEPARVGFRKIIRAVS